MTHQEPPAEPGSTLRPSPESSPLEIEMESALTPREIQARIRGGESLADVARLAGMTTDWVEPFAAPVIAEREYVAAQAQSHPVRRSGETIAHRNLAQVVADRLASRGVELDSVTWDAWKLEGRRWQVRVDYESGKARREALFSYDTGGRFSVAENDDARWLLGLHSASHGPQPGRRRREEDAEPTVGLNEDLALVRVVQPRVDEAADPDDTQPLPEEDLGEYTDDAYTEAELAEVDGIYDIVPGQDSNLDVLYDMLSSFDEDSVQIYAGLIRPLDGSAAVPVLDTVDELSDEPEPEPEPEHPVTRLHPAEPEQLPLPPDEPEEQPQAPARGKRKRAQVPSWDEIMFGSPSPKKRD
ncbi:Protein of unknown function (DUF3071) [Propionicimonas paludicola]|uniref:DUF3071 domain-containing protein n=1 Tax=Propionicimonas paludicola TaxID=185243 RepID=A0A2A9CQY5_9ACTN|nr:septation protein SepH [Propionicimonas paludicola]PFG16601.1 Protein of unknown function (DUF3071) [Propionicimonas paludicola]